MEKAEEKKRSGKTANEEFPVPQNLLLIKDLFTLATIGREEGGEVRLKNNILCPDAHNRT